LGQRRARGRCDGADPGSERRCRRNHRGEPACPHAGARRGRVTVVVDATGQHVYQAGLLYRPFNARRTRTVVRPLRGLLHRRVGLLTGPVESIDPAAQSFSVGGHRLTYDWLVLATGAQLLPERVPGFDHAHHFYDPAHADRLRAALSGFRGGRIVVGPTRKVYKCPPAPLEFVLLLDEYLRKRRLRAATELHYGLAQ
jgi:sulfide:quinone oxidoreductase